MSGFLFYFLAKLRQYGINSGLIIACFAMIT